MMESHALDYTPTALDFVTRRSLESHGAFFLPSLQPGMSVLDCGCGTGSITLGIAERVGDGNVVGVDINEVQVELATRRAAEYGRRHVRFRRGSAYELPFPDASFDAVFSHALLEHLREPERALREFLRVVRPGGKVAVCVLDWGGSLYFPPWKKLSVALRVCNEIQNRGGGDTHFGRKLLGCMSDAGFVKLRAQARYENHERPETITEPIAALLDSHAETALAAATREWTAQSQRMFAQAWVSCIGRRALP